MPARMFAIEDAGSTAYAEYTYLGASTVVKAARPACDGLNLSYGSSSDAGGGYAGLDRFGRVVAQHWRIGQTSIDRFAYGYDHNSNRLYRRNEHLDGANFSEVYHDNAAAAAAYDGLDRLRAFRRGLVPGLHRYYADVRLPVSVHVRIAATGLP